MVNTSPFDGEILGSSPSGSTLFIVMKGNDLRMEPLLNILQVVLPEVTMSFEIPPNQSWYTDEDWIKRYPKAHEIYRIFGYSPNSYVTKKRIK